MKPFVSTLVACVFVLFCLASNAGEPGEEIRPVIVPMVAPTPAPVAIEEPEVLEPIIEEPVAARPPEPVEIIDLEEILPEPTPTQVQSEPEIMIVERPIMVSPTPYPTPIYIAPPPPPVYQEIKVQPKKKRWCSTCPPLKKWRTFRN